jgi:16S rRNA (cytosine1402-N4)-methyltransferase
VPVLAAVVAAWAEDGRRAVDATVGGGGHAALLRATGARVLAIDRDPAAVAAARARPDLQDLEFVTASYGSPPALAAVRAFRPDRILLDLGVSWHQLDADARGFTFRPGAPLDMRMTPGQGASAADVLNTWPEPRLAACFAEYADERRARALARAVVERRARARVRVSDDLVGANWPFTWPVSRRISPASSRRCASRSMTSWRSWPPRSRPCATRSSRGAGSG